MKEFIANTVRVHLSINGNPACGRKTNTPSVSEIEFCGDESLQPMKRITMAYANCSMCAGKVKKQILKSTGKTYSELYNETK